MKKFYVSGLLLVLFAFSFRMAEAQSQCPGPNPPAVFNESWIDPGTGNLVCALYIYNMWPNSRVRVSGVGGVIIPNVAGQTIVVTNDNGYVCYVYDCAYTPVQVTTCDGTFCCDALVPARSTLPVKLVNFSTRLLSGQQVELTWGTTVEEESFKYVVERSTDGKNYQAVGEVKAAGNSNSLTQYSFVDKNNVPSAAFYRLRQVDADGRYIFSKVVYSNNGKSSGRISRIFPNPFQTDIQLIGISASDLNSGNIRVYNTSGQRISFRVSGSNAITIDEAVPPGIYILQMKEQRFKLIKN